MITRTTKNWTTGAVTVDRLFVGATLALHYNSTRVMSDVWENIPYATVYNADSGAVEIVWRDRDSAATDTVDATPDVIAAANDWLLKTATANRKASWDSKVDAAVARAKAVEKGKTVVVVKGRKVPKGTTGEVFWVGPGKNFGPVPRYRGGWSVKPDLRIGFNAAGVTHWTAATNVEVVNADAYFDYDTWVTDEPDHRAAALATLNGGPGYADVVLSAGEDRLGFSTWFAGAAPAAAAA